MLPLIFTVALQATTPASPPDGSYTYVTSLNGAQAGKTTITLKHTETGVQLDEFGAFSSAGQSGSVAASTTLGSDLAPTAFSSTYSGQSQSLHVKVGFNGTTATETSERGSKSFGLPADAKHFVLLDIGLFSGYLMLPSQMQAWSGKPVVAVTPLFAQGFPILPDVELKPNRPPNVPMNDSVLTVSNPVQFSEWYDPKTLVVDELDVPSQGAVVTRQK
ncbi:MAG: hypothetical protein ACXVAF_14875 [Vulcanimicrobiaceae bacterium]